METKIILNEEVKLTLQIVRNLRRKNVSMELTPACELILRVPQHTTQAQIDAYLQANQQGITNACKDTEKAPHFVRKYTENEQFLFLGKNYLLHINENCKNKFEFDGTQFIISHTVLQNASKYFELFYKKRAKAIIKARVIDIAQKLNVKYNSLKITSAKSRWGSCNSKGNVNFSWRLIMALPTVIDYVIIHEFCHLFEFNHSPRFWKLVSQVMPNYKIHKKGLNDNSKFMIL